MGQLHQLRRYIAVDRQMWHLYEFLDVYALAWSAYDQLAVALKAFPIKGQWSQPRNIALELVASSSRVAQTSVWHRGAGLPSKVYLTDVNLAQTSLWHGGAGLLEMGARCISRMSMGRTQEPTVNNNNLFAERGCSLLLVAPTLLGWGMAIGCCLCRLTRVERGRNQ